MRLPRFFEKITPFIFIVLTVGIFFWPVIVRHQVPLPADFVVGVYHPWLDYNWGYPTGVPVKNPITTDVVSFTYPMQTLAVNMLKKGQWPLWNPYILAGTPLLANFQSAPFSPTNFLYFIFDQLTAWSFQIMLQHVLAALFTYFLLRYWKISRLGAFFGGTVYAFSGFNLIWSQWNGHTLAASFIPLIILFSDKWLITRRIIFGAGISIAFFLMLISGYPQVALYLLLAIGLLWLVRIGEIKKKVSTTLFLGAFFLLGVGLAAFQILPGAELLSLSQREVEPHPFDWAFLPWEKVITFVAPDYFGNHATGNYWGPQDYTSNTGFVGVVALGLAGAGAALIKKNKMAWFCFLMLAASLLFAFPTPVSVYLWQSGFLGFNAASAHRSLVLFNLGIALLAGFGIDRLIQKKARYLAAIAVPGIILLGFGIYALASGYQVALRNLIFPAAVFLAAAGVLFVVQKLSGRLKPAVVLLVVALGMFELFRFGWKFTPFSPRELVFPTTPVLDFLMSQPAPVRTTGAAVIPVNLRMPYGIETLEGYDAVYPLTISRFIGAVNSGKGEGSAARRYGTVDNVVSPLVGLANTKYVLVTNKAVPAVWGDQAFPAAFEDKSVVILENKNALPRAHMFYDWEVAGNNQALDELLKDNFPLSKKLVLEELVPVNRIINTTNVKQDVVYTKYQEMESDIKVTTGQDGMLFVSDTWYPGWQAFVDGGPAKIYKADYAFRAVAIPKGTHEVKFIYRPDSFFNGLKISMGSLAATILLIVVFLLGKKKGAVYTWGR